MTRAAPGYPASVRCDDQSVYLTLQDGRVLSLPITDRLRGGTPAQRANYELDDEAVYWPDLDEDIGVNSFLGISEDEMYEFLGYTRYDQQGRVIPNRPR